MNQQHQPEPARNQARGARRDLLASALRLTSGRATELLGELNDAELAELDQIADQMSGQGPRAPAVQRVRALLNASYDRRQREASSKARRDLAAASQPAGPPAPLPAESGSSTDSEAKDHGPDD